MAYLLSKSTTEVDSVKSEKVAQIQKSKNLSVINWKDPIGLGYDIMSANSTRHLPVVDDNGSIVGMISDRDAKKAMIFDQADWVSAKTPQPEFDPNVLARDYMSWPVVTIDENSSIREAASSMLKNKISALLVLRAGLAVGIITTDDLLKTIAREDEHAKISFSSAISAKIYDSPLGPLVQSLANAGI